MIVTPDFNYAKTHTTWGSDFTGTVTFRSLDEKTFLAGWRYQNGNLLGKVGEYLANRNVAGGDCDAVFTLWEFGREQLSPSSPRPPVAGTSTSSSGSTTQNTQTMTNRDYSLAFPPYGVLFTIGVWTKVVPCEVWGSNVPPLNQINLGTPNSSNGGANPTFTLPTILGGGVSVVRPPNEQLGLAFTEFFSQAFRNEQIHLHRPADVANNAADGRKFTLLVDLMMASIKKAYSCINGSPSSSVMDSANTLYSQGKIQEAGALLAAGMNNNCSLADNRALAAKAPEMMDRIKSTFLTLSKFLEDCTSSATPQGARGIDSYPNPCSGELLVSQIVGTIIARGKDPSDVILSFDGQPYMEEADITNLWTDLSLGRPIITKPDGTKEVTTVGGAVITYTPPTATTAASIVLTNGSVVVEVNDVLRFFIEESLVEYDLSSLESVLVQYPPKIKPKPTEAAIKKLAQDAVDALNKSDKLGRVEDLLRKSPRFTFALSRNFSRFLIHANLYLELLALQGDDPNSAGAGILKKESTLRLLEELIQEGLADEDDIEEYVMLLAELRKIYLVKQQFPKTYRGKPSKARRLAGCYQRQISGVSEDFNFKTEGVKFDGFLSYEQWKNQFSLQIDNLEGNLRSVVLLDAKKGYDWIFNQDCSPKQIPKFELPQKIVEGLTNEAIRQVSAANALSVELNNSVQIVWHIADLNAYDCIKELLANYPIKLVHTPFANNNCD